MSSIWTDERVEQLRTRWAAGVSGTEIAREMHTTRNSILGKVDRLGLPLRIKKTKSARRGPRQPSVSVNAMLLRRQTKHPDPAERVAAAAEPTDLPPDQSSFAVPLMKTKAANCRWPLTEGATMLVCGAPQAFESYCGRHARIAYPNWRG